MIPCGFRKSGKRWQKARRLPSEFRMLRTWFFLQQKCMHPSKVVRWPSLHPPWTHFSIFCRASSFGLLLSPCKRPTHISTLLERSVCSHWLVLILSFLVYRNSKLEIFIFKIFVITSEFCLQLGNAKKGPLSVALLTQLPLLLPVC